MTPSRATTSNPARGFIAWLLAGLVLALALLGASPRAHAFLHGDADHAHASAAHDDGGCAIALFQHGVTAPLALPLLNAPRSRWIGTLPHAGTRTFRSAPDIRLMPAQGPPHLG